MSIKKGSKVISGAPLEPVWGTISGDIQDQADLLGLLATKADANSPTLSGTPTAPTPPVGSYDDRIATTSYVQQAIESVDGLPSQTGHNGQFLTTNGSSASWATVDALPSQASQAGKFLTTNGTTASWQTIDLSGKVDKVTSATDYDQIYAKGTDGSQSMINLTSGILANAIIRRKSDGTISTNTPVVNDDAVNLSYLNTALSTTVKSNDVIQNMNTHGRAERLWMSEIHDVLYKADNRFNVTGTGFTTFDASRLFNGSFEDYYCKLEAGNTGTIVISGSSITGTYRSGFIFVSFYSNWSPHSADQITITIENASGNVATLTPEAWETKGSGASAYVTVVRAIVPSLSTANAISKITITITNSGSDDICPTEIEYFLSRPSSIELLPVVTKFSNNTIYGSLTANSFVKSGGTSSQFLKADGSVDTNTYVKTSDVTSTYSATGTAPVNGTAVASAISGFEPLPTQAGNSGKFLTTDGTNASWATVDALPSQSGQSGKYLTTNGTAASWASLPTYSSGTGISVSGTTINHSNSVTAGTAGTSSATSGSSLAVPYVTYDAQGHITASGTHTHTVTGFLTSNDIDQTYSGTSANAQSGVAVKSAIDAAVASVYKPAGSVAFANRPTLASSIEGNVYNITDAFTTTSDFVEGTGHNYPAGTNIVCINTAESGQTAVYKWDVLAGFVDLSGYVTKDGGSAQQTIQLTSGTGTTAFGVKSRSSSSYISLSGTSGWLGSYGVTSDKTPTFYNGTSYTLAYVENTVASNTAITGATKCKITYDSKGLVTAGADLTASDIPNLSLSKITDVTASATELNYVDGVTSNVQTQLDNKPDFTDYGLIVPDTSKMDVLKTITYTVSANSVYRFGNFSNNISNLWDIKGDAIFRITVTGTNINQQIEGIISMRQVLESPFIVIRNRRGNSSAATSGIRYIYSRYPRALNSGYNWQFDFACYDATERTIKIEILKNDIGFSWEESLTSSTYDSTYQSSATLTAYTTDGIIGIPTLNWASSSASTAGYLTSYLPKMIAGTQPLAGAALLASQLCFMSSNKMYPSTSKTLPIDTGYGICFNSTATSSGLTTAYNYLRQKVSATSLTNIPHATLARGNSCYFRCTMDVNGNILSDNYVATSMAAGYTWYYIGIAQSSSAINIDTTNSVFLTLDSNGSLTHINGKKITTTDLSNYQTKITSSAKLSADLISDGTTNKIVTATEKSTWSGKQDALVSGTNIKTINNQSILGSGNIDIQSGTTVEAYTASEVQTIWDSVTPTS